MKTITHRSALLFIGLLSGLLAGISGCSNYQPTPPAGMDARETTEGLELRTRMSKASDVFTRLTTTQEIRIPEGIVNNARCVAVLLDVVQAAFLAGGKYGQGVVSCRGDDNSWSTPAFDSLSGASIGVQIGADKADIVLFFMDEAARRTLISKSVTLGGDVAVSAGPVGSAKSGSTNIEFSGIVSYSLSQGLFAGLTLQGGVFTPDDDANASYYGQELSMAQLLFGKSVSLAPPEAGRFLSSLSSVIGPSAGPA